MPNRVSRRRGMKKPGSGSPLRALSARTNARVRLSIHPSRLSVKGEGRVSVWESASYRHAKAWPTAVRFKLQPIALSFRQARQLCRSLASSTRPGPRPSSLVMPRPSLGMTRVVEFQTETLPGERCGLPTMPHGEDDGTPTIVAVQDHMPAGAVTDPAALDGFCRRWLPAIAQNPGKIAVEDYWRRWRVV
jgi:hypothetical protein